MPRLQVLNPNVSVKAEREGAEEKSDDYFTQFDVICATCCTTDTLVRNSPKSMVDTLARFFPIQLRLDELCRSNGVKFFCGDVWGYYGYCFTDLNHHEYAM